MTDPAGADHLARCEQLLQAAEAYERSGDWENAVGKYRELNSLDHLYKGAEAKLLFALTERDAGKSYNEGMAHMSAGRYAEALDAFRKAKVRAGVYRDASALIKECEQRLAGAEAAPAVRQVAARKGCLGVLLLFLD
jgi:tetratricopeptide (TPR) repeat protein